MSDRRLRDLERTWRASRSPEALTAYLDAWRRHHPDQEWLVYRSPYDDPAGKRVVPLRATSIVDWFRRGWQHMARVDAEEEFEIEDAARDWVERETRGGVYGLSSVFAASRLHRLAAPRSWDHLRELLSAHLYLEGPPPQMDDGLTIRAVTDDDEIDLAYFVLTSSYAAAYPERTAWLLRPSWRLPAQAAAASSVSPEPDLPQVEPAGPGGGATWVVDMSVRDGGHLGERSREGAVQVVPGVRVPGLPDYLRGAEDVDWPPVLRGLRVALGRRERTLQRALKRLETYGTDALARVAGAPDYDAVRLALGAAWPKIEAQHTAPRRATIHGERELPSRAARSAHHLQLSRWNGFCYDVWVVFDDLWASAHPDLAASLVRWGRHWDPLRD